MKKKPTFELPAHTDVADDLLYLGILTTNLAGGLKNMEESIAAFRRKWVKTGLPLGSFIKSR